MKSRRAKLEEQKCSPSAEGFLFAAQAQGLRAPWNPGRGPPCTACFIAPSGGPLPGPLAEGQGCRGRAPPTPCRQACRSGRVKGPCPRPYGAAGRTNPLTRPSLKTRQRPAQGLEGHCRSGWGSRLAQRHAQRLGLDAQERPPRLRAGGWGAFPQPPATWRTPPEGRRRRS